MSYRPQSGAIPGDDFARSMHRYQSTMHEVKAPAELKRAVLARAHTTESRTTAPDDAGERAKESPRIRTATPASSTGRPFTKRFKIALCIGLAAALLCAGSIVGWSLTSEQANKDINDKAELEQTTPEPPSNDPAQIGSSRDNVQVGAQTGTGAASGAASAPKPESEPIEILPVFGIGFGLGGYCNTGYDPELDRFLDPYEWSGFKYRFDPTCTGDNIETITYELIGEHAYFELIAPYNDDDTYGFAKDNPYGATPGRTYFYTKQVSFAYDKQGFKPDDVVHSIYLRFPLTDEEADIMHGILNGTYPNKESDHRAGDRLTYLQDWGAGQELAKNRLRMTLAFTDGSTETKTLLIAPVADFETLCTDAIARNDELRDSGAYPQLYSVTVVDE